MQLRTQAFVLVFSLLAVVVGVTVIGIVGGFEALKTGNTVDMPSPYKDLYWSGVGIAAILLVMLYRTGCKAQDLHRQSKTQPKA